MLLRTRRWWSSWPLAVFCALGAGAGGCSFESAPLTGSNGLRAPTAPAVGGDRSSGAPIPDGAQGAEPIPVAVPDGAAGPEAPPSAGTGPAGAGAAGGASGAPSTPPEDAATPPPPPVDPVDAATPPPVGGELFSRCVIDEGCAEGLKCYGEGPGFCTDPCSRSSDCTDHQGIDFTCYTQEGQCRVDCSSTGTNGDCPTPLICTQDPSGETRCLLPREEGTHDRELYEACDRAHGNADCVSGLVCFRSSTSRIDGPGYCTEPCFISECAEGPDGTQIACTNAVCRFRCDDDAECPGGMACEEQGETALCHYPR